MPHGGAAHPVPLVGPAVRPAAATDGFVARYPLARRVIAEALRPRRPAARDRTHNLAKTVQTVSRRPRRLRPRAGDAGGSKVTRK